MWETEGVEVEWDLCVGEERCLMTVVVDLRNTSFYIFILFNTLHSV